MNKHADLPFVFGTLLFVAGVVACGSNLRATQRSDNAFERCYASDFDAEATRDARRACWTAWLEDGDGQPPHRLTYARDRLAALDRGDEQDSLPGLPEAAERATGTEAVFENAGVELERSELQVAENVVAASVSDAGVADGSIDPPIEAPAFGNPACGRVCDPRFRDCQTRCDPSHGAACNTACVVEHRTCMRACF